MAAYHQNVKVVLHLANVPIADGENVVAGGLQRIANFLISNTYDSYFVLIFLNFLRTRRATAELPTKVAVQ